MLNQTSLKSICKTLKLLSAASCHRTWWRQHGWRLSVMIFLSWIRNRAILPQLLSVNPTVETWQWWATYVDDHFWDCFWLRVYGSYWTVTSSKGVVSSWERHAHLLSEVCRISLWQILQSTPSDFIYSFFFLYRLRFLYIN